jgi:outer membrane immunogenic protein
MMTVLGFQLSRGVISMRRIIAAAVIAISSWPVLAADMAEPVAVLRGALPASHDVDFAGFYVGAFAGYNQQTFSSRDPLSSVATGNILGTRYATYGQANVLALPERTSTNAMGLGGFIGHNWGIDGYIVGIEADYTRSRMTSNTSAARSGEFTDPTTLGLVNPNEINQYSYTTRIASSARVSDYGTLRVRAGMPFGSVMPYVTGGLAWARTSYGLEGTLAGQARRISSITGAPVTAYAADAAGPGPVVATTGMKMVYGYALGAGLEWALTSNIIVRGELMTMRFSDYAGGLSKRSVAGQNLNAGGSSTQNDTMAINTARLGAAVKF